MRFLSCLQIGVAAKEMALPNVRTAPHQLVRAARSAASFLWESGVSLFVKGDVWQSWPGGKAADKAGGRGGEAGKRKQNTKGVTHPEAKSKGVSLNGMKEGKSTGGREVPKKGAAPVVTAKVGGLKELAGKAAKVGKVVKKVVLVGAALLILDWIVFA